MGVEGASVRPELQLRSCFAVRLYRAEDAIERSKEIYGPLGGKFNEAKLRWRMPNGGRMAFAYLESVADADEYQGRNVTDAWIEEAGQYPTSAPIDRLFGVLRSTHVVPVQLILTANPGGAGQHWLRERYGLHPFPRGPKILTRTLPNGQLHQVAVIPSRIRDNQILMQRDPGYIGRLHMVGSAELVRAWLDGDWTAIEGAFFDCWSERKHVVYPFEIPAGLAAVSIWRLGVGRRHSRSDGGPSHLINSKLRKVSGFREAVSSVSVSGTACSPGKPNVGLKLHAEEVGKGIAEREQGESIAYGVLDPSAFKEDGGPSIAERIARGSGGKVWFRHADNTRVPARGAMGGWDQVRSRLVGDGDGRPMIVTFATCTDSIRTIPILQHDPDRPEDVMSDSEDHAGDEWRYACMSRPWVPMKEAPKPENISGYRPYRTDEQPGDWLTY